MKNSTITIKSQYHPSSLAINVEIVKLFLPCLITSYVSRILGSSHASIHAALSLLVLRFIHQGGEADSATTVETILVLLLSQVLVMVFKQRRIRYSKDSHGWKNEQSGSTNTWATGSNESTTTLNRPAEEILGSLLFPSRTTHRRLFPTQHSFSYSYLLAGVPVNDHGVYNNSLLSSHAGYSKTRQAWFSVHSTDYLQRGSSLTNLSLRKKLELFLKSEGTVPSTLPFAYLVTAPRFLEWSFNPVSFWYLYNSDKVLSAMILEVNNTFDERRMYLLHADSNSREPTLSKMKKFTAKWKKDFHVSPFNDRTGTYNVTAADIVATRTVDVTIVLNDMEHKPKLVARIHSTLQMSSSNHNTAVGTGVDPISMVSRRTRLVFLFQHGWKGFCTNPRILREAWTLWRKKLMVYFRPEPFSSSIGRNETKEEIVLEHVFRRVLELLAQESGTDVQYISAAGTGRGKYVHVAGKNTPRKGKHTETEQQSEALRLQILSPQIYTELATADGSLLAVFERFCFCADERQTLVSTSNEHALRQLLMAGREVGDDEMDSTAYATWPQSAISFLRLLKARGLAQALQALLKSAYLWDTNSFRPSELDNIVLRVLPTLAILASECQSPRPEHEKYLRAAFQVLLTDRLAFGSPALLKIQESFCRAATTVLLTGVTVKLFSASGLSR